MSENLTPQQREAVTNRGGKLLVSAAAGSGKTKVLVDRLMSYVTDPETPANLDDFLIITYTKAAAAELRGKISKKLIELMSNYPENRHLQQQMQRLHLAKISTVHSFCADILREYAYRLDLSSDFRVADELECNQIQLTALEQIITDAYETITVDSAFKTFIDTQGLGRNDRIVPQLVLKVYNSAMCHLDPERWLDWCLETTTVDGLQDAAQTVWGAYLLEDLKNTASLHKTALQSCIHAAEFIDGFAKPAVLLQSIVEQLTVLENVSTWDQVVNFGKIEYGRLTFPRKCTDPQLAEQMKEIRNACKKALDKKLAAFADTSEQILSDLKTSSIAANGLISLVRSYASRYSELKSKRRILDFSDLEHKTLDLLLGKKRTGPTYAAKEISQRFREIMVDEYQDSNGVQDAIFSTLTAERQNCFMVGDVKQSIYQFRLADPGIFIDKYNCYVPAENAKNGQGRKVLLSNNFRSSQGIISAVNFVFSLCMSKDVGGLSYGTDEMLYEGIPHTDIGEPEVELYGIEIDKDTYAEEAAFVAQRISQLLDGTHMIRRDNVLCPIKASDIVILLRSPGSVGGEFRWALEQRGIHCVTGDNKDLLSSDEIITLKSLLQVIDNPLQDIPLVSIMASPLFAFSADDLAKLRIHLRKGSIYEAVKINNTPKTCHFIEVLEDLRMDCAMGSITELLSSVFNKTNIESIYGAMDSGQERIQNLYTFCQLASNFENSDRRDLASFLQYLDSLEERGIALSSSGGDSESVTIMSIHKSKGLEFPVVFLCGLSRRFNEESAREPVLCHKDLGLGLNCVNTQQRYRYPSIAKRAISTRILSEGLSEELRVLYVAMTRARDRLIMTYAVKNLEADLQEIGARKVFSPINLLTSSVNCPGEWILQSALSRIEAGEFFALSGPTSNATIEEPLWKINVVRAPDVISSVAEAQPSIAFIDNSTIESMKAGLAFQYAHQHSTTVPSKITATQLKGRIKDSEISENVPHTTHIFREANFAAEQRRGTEYGTAIHTLMQYICYENCETQIGVEKEIARLVTENILSQDIAEHIQSKEIVSFFHTELGKKLTSSTNILREFKFSVLMDAEKYYPDVKGEEILLQGVMDCVVIEDNLITVLDFKTDHLNESNAAHIIEQYRLQVNAYADALTQIFEGKQIESYLYFFKNAQLVKV